MADNITLNSGSGGATLAADDVSSVWYQRVKLVDGTLDSTTAIASGGGVESGALRVTVASDSTGVLSVDDNGGALTVDNAGTFAVQATVAAAATNIAKAEDDASANADVGVPAMAVRKGTPANTSGTDGDYEFLQMSAGRLWVDPSGVTLTVGSHAVTNAGAFAVQVDGAALTSLQLLDDAISGSEMQVDVVGALPAGTNAIGKLAANSGVDIGDVDVTSISAGANLIGDVGISGARTSGGTTIFRSIDIDESEEEIKASAGQVYWIHAMNLTASVLYLKFYNATAASVTVGTTTPVLTFPIATQATTSGAGFVLAIPNGIAFGTAICVACTTGLADNDTGAPAANACVINIGYA